MSMSTFYDWFVPADDQTLYVLCIRPAAIKDQTSGISTTTRAYTYPHINFCPIFWKIFELQLWLKEFNNAAVTVDGLSIGSVFYQHAENYAAFFSRSETPCFQYNDGEILGGVWKAVFLASQVLVQ